MSELEQYYQEYACGNAWIAEDASECGCRGRGWFLSQVDTWHRCPVHGKGAAHPEVEPEEESGVHQLFRDRAGETHWHRFALFGDRVYVTTGWYSAHEQHQDMGGTWYSREDARKAYARLRRQGFAR